MGEHAKQACFRLYVGAVTIPTVPGYIEPPRGDTLDGAWTQPPGVPEALWPRPVLRAIQRYPIEWITLEEHASSDAGSRGFHTVMVMPGDVEVALLGWEWVGRGVGDVGLWDDGRFENGLVVEDPRHGGVKTEFLLQVRTPMGAPLPAVEVAQPFIWYYDAFPVADGWDYLNWAGRNQELIRYSLDEDGWQVRVRALELRQFLAACGRSAIVQADVVTRIEPTEFDRIDDELHNDWAHFAFYAVTDHIVAREESFSRLCGQWAIGGQRNARLPRVEARSHLPDVYPEFVYGVDATTGALLTHTCDPDQLGNYFVKDGRLHYLTPVYFKREVLQPYDAEPTRYRLTTTRLECLNLWGVDISFNSAGLVEVYLGDIGRDLPADDWGHWRSYNVPPEGTMDEGRFRRDFLNQWASSTDVAGDLRSAREGANEIAAKVLGAPLWKPLVGEINAQWNSLLAPLTDDPTALGQRLLTMTKVLVDGIDPAPLKSRPKNRERGDQSLRLLQKLCEELGDENDVTATLRELQAFRSKGGVAHLAGSKKDTAAAALGISGLANVPAFDSIATRLTRDLRAVARLLECADQ
ncbi:MAG: hypothetical protein QOD07_166 [Frankiaceae bacterium]|nr:hypothetical protein [Frankiaceae bacterium]